MTPPAVLRWKPLATKYAGSIGANTILSVIEEESAGNPQAVNPPAPAVPRDRGLMQIEIPTARQFGSFPPDATDEEIGLVLLNDPDANVRIGAACLAHLKQTYEAAHPLTLLDGSPNPLGWIAAYNEGPGNLWRKVPDLPYVSAFLQHLTELETEETIT